MGDEIFQGAMDKLNQASIVATDIPAFHKDRHISYWLRCLRTPLPHHYTGSDSNRLSLAFFTVSALDLLGILFTRTTALERQNYIDWIYKCQHPHGGFRGFPRAESDPAREALDLNLARATVPATFFALSALCVLEDDLSRVDRRACLAWLKTTQRSNGSFGELLDGEEVRGGTDSRFGYSAMAIRWILRGKQGQDRSGNLPDINAEALVRCVQESKTFDGGIADEPFHEAHAGFTFCGVAALALAQRMVQTRASPSSRQSHRSISDNTSFPSTVSTVGNLLGEEDKTIRWLLARLTTALEEDEPLSDGDEDLDEAPEDTDSATLEPSSQLTVDSSNQPFAKFRSYPAVEVDKTVDDAPTDLFDLQTNGVRLLAGFNGRCNKVADTCYAFWVAGSLSLLDSLSSIDLMPVRRYLLEQTQHVIAGGFGKFPGDPPDIYHSYMALAALALIDGRKDDDPVIGPDIEMPHDTSHVHSSSGTKTEADDRKERKLRALDSVMCFSLRARKWVENLDWHRAP